ncbi:YcaO-like family protein [Pseudomonas capeferrum]|uniref:YcaO-like family protein n=1 Tax=Pseudomonas capeferrum TaxID=1495066 RepID=UPI0015E30E8E|nr:YcaO-like family protein [Pseudomonas capeferrum]MBA1202846.1 YcaO-like family protein [Pseudomonas capeferrum]
MIPERELKPCEAKLRLHLLCEKLELAAHVKKVGAEGLVASCSLYDKSGVTVSSGAGKGDYCELGALAESIEHYLTETNESYQPAECASATFQECQFLQDDWLLKSIPIGKSLSSYELQGVDQEAKINVPAVLLTPTEKAVAEATSNPALAFLAKYSSNSGTAIGCTENEALLHGINEAIERHALSIYYLSLCELSPPLKLYKPAASFMEENFIEHPALHQYSKTLDLVVTQEFYGAYFCIAVPKTTNPNRISVIGSGYSACSFTAVYRAVSEQLQCAKLQNSEDIETDKTISEILLSVPRLEKLLHLNPARTLEIIYPRHEKLSVHTQIKNILISLRKNNRSVFHRTLFNEPGLACAMQIYIPGLERFHLIRSGCPVVPQSALSRGTRDRNVFL